MVFNKLYNFEIFLSSFEACDHISNNCLLASLLNTPEDNIHSHIEHSNLACKVNHFIYRPLFQVDLLPCSLFHWADFNFVSQQYETFTKRWRIITIENGISLWYSLRSLGCRCYRQKLEGSLEGKKSYCLHYFTFWFEQATDKVCSFWFRFNGFCNATFQKASF